MWIPRSLYERTAFDIGLPRNTRQELATQDSYPYYTNCGYPTSGSLAFPAKFDNVVPQNYVGAGCRSAVGWGGVCCGGYRRSQTVSAVRQHQLPDDADEVIPGTQLTKSQLNSKVHTCAFYYVLHTRK